MTTAGAARAASDVALAGRGLVLSYGATPALRGADLELRAGEGVALMGPSGSGKSSLLHCLAGVLVPDEGEVTLLGGALSSLGAEQRSRRRLVSIGLVLQFGGLIAELTLLENAMLPLQLTGSPRGRAREEAMTALAAFGVDGVAGRRAGQVSGGQAQRAAVARALVHRPPVILADEPTGALDSVSAEAVMTRLVSWAAETSAALLVVTHDHRMAAHLPRHAVIRDGVVSGGLAGDDLAAAGAGAAGASTPGVW